METATPPTPTKPAFDWKNWANGQRIILIAGAAAIFSLFLPWVDIGIATRNGFEKNGWIGVALFAFPVYAIIARKATKKWVSVVLAVAAIFVGAAAYAANVHTVYHSMALGGTDAQCEDPAYRAWQQAEPCQVETLDLNGSGVVAYLVASAAFLVGGIMETRRKPVAG